MLSGELTLAIKEGRPFDDIKMILDQGADVNEKELKIGNFI
jgi:hypothetical protein